MQHKEFISIKELIEIIEKSSSYFCVDNRNTIYKQRINLIDPKTIVSELKKLLAKND